MMSQSLRTKGATTDEAFKEECFLWEGGASVSVDIYIFKFEEREEKTTE